MIRKQYYKELFYLFGSHSNYDNENMKFNEVYELYGLKFNLNNFYSDKFNDYIPYEGNIPNDILKKLKDIKINNNIIKTSPITFINLLTELHDFYTNLYHDGIYKTVKGREKEIIIHTLNKYLSSNGLFVNNINELSRMINNYYLEHFDNNNNEVDLKINEILEDIDNHDDLSYFELINYKEMTSKNDNLIIRDYRLGSSYSLMNHYIMDSDDFSEIIDYLDIAFFKGIKLKGDNEFEIIRYAKEKTNDEYSLKDFNKGVNNLNIIYERNINGYKKLSYNLNTHELVIRLIGDSYNFKINKIINDKEKELLLKLLYSVKKKIDYDLRKDNTFSKRYR